MSYKHYKAPCGRRRTGSVIVFVALAIVVLLGMCAYAVDYGNLTFEANRAQRAVDAAALAGARQLKVYSADPTDNSGAEKDRKNAEDEAKTVLSTNISNSSMGVVGTPVVTFNTDQDKITVSVTITSHSIFANILGIRRANLTRAATAQVLPCNAAPVPNPLPLGITTDTYNAYVQDGVKNVGKNNPTYRDFTFIDQNQMIYGKDTFVPFDMRNASGKSPAHFQAQLDGTEVVDPPPTIDPVDFENTLNGNSYRKFFEDGIGGMMTKSATSPWNDTPVTGTDWETIGSKYPSILNGISPVDSSGNPNPRIRSFIVNPPPVSPPVNGTYNTQVVGFLPIYIQQVYLDRDGLLHMIIGILPPQFDTSSCGVAPNGTPLTGVRRVVLDS